MNTNEAADGGTEPPRPGPDTVTTDDSNRAVDAESPTGDQTGSDSASGQGDIRTRNRGAEKRIKRLTSQRAAALQQLDEAEAELERLRAENAALRQQAPKPAKPTLADFDGDAEAYGEAYAEWKSASAKSREQAKAPPKPRKRRNPDEPTQKEIEDFLADGQAELGEDFRKAQHLASEQKFELSAAMASYLLDAEQGAALFVKLSQEPEAASRIARLSTVQSALAMRELESALGVAKAAANELKETEEPEPTRDQKGRYAKRGGSGSNAPPPGPRRDGQGTRGGQSVYEAKTPRSGQGGAATHSDLDDWMQQRFKAAAARQRR